MHRHLALASAVVCACGTPAGATEVCVSCEAPEAEYRCDVERREEIEKYGVADDVTAHACVQVLKRLGAHGACRIKQADNGPCTGAVKTIGLSDLQKAVAGGSSDTVVPSLGERAGNAAQSAGDTIGSAFKKSWNCLTSLFQECG